MKRRIIFISIIFISLFIITSCNKETNSETKDNNLEKENIITEKEEINSVKIIINEKEYTLNLENNETVLSLIDLLPIELDMNELNGNEKYTYLNKSLPTNSINPKNINKGDVMLYGDNCLVIFYKSFETSYSYTKIGHIDNLPDLDNNNIKIKIEK